VLDSEGSLNGLPRPLGAWPWTGTVLGMEVNTDQDLPDRLWTVSDVAAFLRVSPTRVRELADVDGFPPPIILGAHSWRWDPAAVRAWVTAQHEMPRRPRRGDRSPRGLVERV
jgi:predicted DNA-binding transcriptional regulator AlpA